MPLTSSSSKFTGQTPLQLYHTHESLAQYYKRERPNYWTEPQVWLDMKACFDRYFELNGDDTDWRHNYVMCAWRCQQWHVLNEEIAKIKWVNYDYFGGRAKFEEMQRQASLRSAKATTPPQYETRSRAFDFSPLLAVEDPDLIS